MLDKIIEFCKASPVICAAIIGLGGAILGSFIAFFTQNRILKFNRTTEWNRRRKEAHAKWIAIYIDDLFRTSRYLDLRYCEYQQKLTKFNATKRTCSLPDTDP